MEQLTTIEWDFTEADTGSSTHSIHPYPAKFIPQIPRALIEHLSIAGDTVYEPFLGSGTTAVEAQILGRNVIGNDVNELAVLISNVKTTPVDEEKLKLLDDVLNRAYLRIDSLHLGKSNGIVKPEILNLDLWFKEFVINEVVIIKEEVLRLVDEPLRNLALVALSGILVNVSNQDSDTRYVRVPKDLKPFDVFERFSRQLKKLKRVINESSQDLKKGKSEFRVADTREPGIFPKNSADVSITSPPYPNAYDYHLYHKYRMFWLDMNPHQLRKLEIGAHADYSKPKGLDEFDFMRDMEACLNNTSQILKPNGYFALVIGDSILKGRAIKNNEVIKEAAKKTPFDFVTEFERNLNLRKKSFNPKIGNIKTEKIVIFRNCK